MAKAKKTESQQSRHYMVERLAALPWVLIGAVLLVAAIIAIGTSTVSRYNDMVALRNTADAQWQQVEVQYQRRFDLVPNLVATVEGAQVQEKEIITQISDARTRYGSAGSVNDKAVAASQLDSAISRLLLVVENYPELASSQLMQNLQAELAGTENKIGAERLRFNDDVRAYNTFIQTFPNNAIASVFQFEQKQYFTSATEAQIAPKVEINTNQ